MFLKILNKIIKYLGKYPQIIMALALTRLAIIDYRISSGHKIKDYKVLCMPLYKKRREGIAALFVSVFPPGITDQASFR